MFGIKIRSHGPVGGTVPPGQQYAPGTDIGPALMPIPATFAAAWQSNGQIHGAPGTERIPAPAPFPGLDRCPVAQATEGIKGMPSSDVPYWYPTIYYQTDLTNPELAPPVTYLNSPHTFPVPAERPQFLMAMRAVNSPGGITPAGGAFAARLGGRWPIGWPKVIANYPNYGAPESPSVRPGR